MQDTNAKKCSFLVAILLIASVVLRVLMISLSLPSTVGLAFYALIILCVAFAGIGIKNKVEIQNVFLLGESKRAGAFSYVAGVGFFLSFVVQCLAIYKKIDTGKYKDIIHFLPICAVCVFAILSSFYFICVATSLCNRAYDFRKLKIFHIAPFLWSVFYTLSIMSYAIKPLKDIDLMLKYIALLTLVLFLYFLAGDVQSSSSSNKATIVFARMFSVFGFMYFVDRMFCVIASRANAFDSDSLLSITLFLICLFAFSFEREALRNSN